MSEDIDLRQFGGVPEVMTAKGDGPQEAAWNFGVLSPNLACQEDADAPGLYDRFPALQGKWDGRSMVNHHESARRVLGKDLEPHQQPAGTCGGRAGSRTLELLQCVLIASGKRAKFKYVSHAWPYYLARKEYGMIGRGDGVPDGSIPPVLAKYGALHREEAGDPEMAGRTSDNLAREWGGRGIPRDTLDRLTGLAKDNIVTAMVKVRSAEELADGLAAGGIACCSDGQGYSMTRDSEGFCRAQGTWYHYHVRSGVGVSPSGRKFFAYDQSWGPTVPGGPRLPGWPSNCFAVEYDTQDRLCRSGSVHVLFSLSLWDLENNNIDPTPWTF